MGRRLYIKSVGSRRTKSNESHLAFFSCLADSLHALQLQGWITSEEYLWSILNRSPSGIHKLLQEHLPEYPICLVSEYRAKDDSDSVVTRFDVDGLFFTIVYRHDLTSLCNALRCRLRGVM